MILNCSAPALQTARLQTEIFGLDQRKYCVRLAPASSAPSSAQTLGQTRDFEVSVFTSFVQFHIEGDRYL